MAFSHVKNPREIAFLAILSASREEQFISDILEQWRNETAPSSSDYRLAQQIAYGTIQMTLTLDYFIKQLSDRKTLPTKLKEKVLLRMALYQVYFLERIPLYAINNEMQKISRQYCHEMFVRYMNAVLRKMEIHVLQVPSGNYIEDISIRYSYPEYFVQSLLQHYGLEKTLEILTLENLPAPIMARVRSSAALPEGIKKIPNLPCHMALVTDLSLIPTIASSSDYYIQNSTPAVLITELVSHFSPNRILDLCASPGGKLVSLHDAYPQAILYANDVSEEKIKRIQENCHKYGIDAILSCAQGESFISSESFDIIVLDLPCSNSGVLNKRPEARWRLFPEYISELRKTQMALIRRAKDLLAPNGQIWMMTCSILPEENEELAATAAQQLGLKIAWQKTILPNRQGADGGFACIMTIPINLRLYS